MIHYQTQKSLLFIWRTTSGAPWATKKCVRFVFYVCISHYYFRYRQQINCNFNIHLLHEEHFLSYKNQNVAAAVQCVPRAWATVYMYYGTSYFILPKKDYADIVLGCIFWFVTYVFNCVIKSAVKIMSFNLLHSTR